MISSELFASSKDDDFLKSYLNEEDFAFSLFSWLDSSSIWKNLEKLIKIQNKYIYISLFGGPSLLHLSL